MVSGFLRVLTQIQSAIIPLATQGKDDDRGDWQQQHVEDAKEDGTGRDADRVAPIGETKGNGIEKPEEVHPARQDVVVSAKAHALGRGAAVAQGVEGQHEPGDGAEGVEAPFVVTGSVGRHEVGDDPFVPVFSRRISGGSRQDQAPTRSKTGICCRQS